MPLTSTKNPRLQGIRRAAAAGRLTEDGLAVIEGPHLLAEALRSSWQIAEVFVTAAAYERNETLVDRVQAPVTELSPRAMASIAATENTQEIAGLIRPRQWTWPDLLTDKPIILALDGVQDPGNAGTMVRSAEAFGASGIVLLKGSVRSSNGKFMRATAGSIFRVPFLEGLDAADLLRQVQQAGLPVYALSPKGSLSLRETKLADGGVLVVGSEGAGVSAELLAAAKTVHIPTLKVESLNAAVACSVALYAMQPGRECA
jgi:TrmH family RNA methyltransferase